MEVEPVIWSLKDAIQDLLARADDSQAQSLLHELQPFDIASVLLEFDEERQLKILAMLTPGRASETLERLDYDEQYRLLHHLPQDKARSIIASMSVDAIVDLMGAIHPRQAQEILTRVPPEDVGRIRFLMSYPENSAGGRMTLDYLAVRQDWTVERVIAHFRKVGSEVRVTNYIYVVDREGRLVGVTSMRDVLLSNPDTPVSEIMHTRVISVEVHADQEEAARLLSQYDFVALPVVNPDGRLAGVITLDDILDIIEEEDTEDIQRIGGSQPLDEPYMKVGMFNLFRKRIGWLLLLFVTQSVTANILRFYQDILSQIVVLTFFIPLLIDTGGNSGSQASTVVIRAMAVGEVRPGDFRRVVRKEMRISLALGAVMAAAGYVFSLIMGNSAEIGLTVATTLMLVVVTSSMVGAMLPLFGKRLGLDPAVFSSPLITTIVDCTGLLMYFQVARLILGLGR